MRILLFLLCATLLCGCGGSKKKGPATVKVSGKVTHKSMSLEGAIIEFISPDGDHAGNGRIGADGSYTLTTGAVPGQNKVVIKKVVGDAAYNPAEGMDEGQFEAAASANPGAAKAKKIGETLPPIYSDSAKTILKFNVPDSGTDSANFDLN